MRVLHEPYVSAVDCNNVFKFTISDNRPSSVATYTYIDDEFYADSQGIIRRYKKSTVKGDNIDSVKRSFSRLADLINTNYVSPDNVLFLTLTYAINPEIKKLNRDMQRFFNHMKNLDKAFEYIYVVEQQKRGAWHVHALLFYEHEAPYISKGFLDEFWRFADKGNKERGFWKITRVNDDGQLGNVGAYIIAHFTDVKNSHGVEKNARLMNYKSGLHLYRCSKGVKRPVKYSDVPYQKYKDYIAEHDIIYEKQVENFDMSLYWRYEHYRGDL